MCKWLMNLIGLKQSYAVDESIAIERRNREMKWLIEEIKNLNRHCIAEKFVLLETDMKELACFDVRYALDIFQHPGIGGPKLWSFLSALEMVEVYQFHIKNPVFISALNSKALPSLQDIVLRAVRTTNGEGSIEKIKEILKESADLRKYIEQNPAAYSRDPDWSKPDPKTTWTTQEYKKSKKFQ